MKTKQIHSALFGLAIGDALGVPVEFKSREFLKQNPVKDMLEFGSHNQPAGTWSDDSSLTFCLAESLCKKYNLEDIAQKFVKWYKYGSWTAHGNVFDIGITTKQSINNISKGIPAALCGGQSVDDNGNGSLMRILPLIFYIKEFPIYKRFEIVRDVSAITHAHIRSVIACFVYLEFALQLLTESDKLLAFNKMKEIVNQFLNIEPICSQQEIDKFHRVLGNHVNNFELQQLENLTEAEINSSGYVIDTLEASIWCFLTTSNYQEAVLKAVNLGQDTDTTGCVTGGLAGLFYGFQNIPEKLINALARKDDIIDLCDRLQMKLLNNKIQ
jgi:ADP-ribosyl-[dinitrogen reductase] hydrolase